MSAILIHARERRTIRRAVHIGCLAYTRRGLAPVGDEVLDLSPDGLLLVGAHHGIPLGEGVIVSVRAPGTSEWLNAEAEVARIVRGWRLGDPGLCLGLRFTYVDEAARLRLASRLHGMPPPIPRRPLRVDYARSVISTYREGRTRASIAAQISLGESVAPKPPPAKKRMMSSYSARWWPF